MLKIVKFTVLLTHSSFTGRSTIAFETHAINESINIEELSDKYVYILVVLRES